MQKSEILDAMHLLLATNTFSPQNLKALVKYDDYDPRSNFMKRLKAIYESCANNEKLIQNSLLEYFPEHTTVALKGLDRDSDALALARYLTDDNINDVFAVHGMASSLGQMFCIGYDMYDVDSPEITIAICESDPYVLRELQEDLAEIQKEDKFCQKTINLIRGLQGTLNYIKREELDTIIRPNIFPRDDEELKSERALRFSDFARYSLHSLGECLAILYPIYVVIFADRATDFESFITDLKLIEIVNSYMNEAREVYGPIECSGMLCQYMTKHTAVFFNPDDEPENDESHCCIGDIRGDFAQISEILFEQFYT